MTDRIPLDHLTSDALDALYEQLEAAEETESQRQLATAREALASATTRAARVEAALARALEAAAWTRRNYPGLTSVNDRLTAALDPPTPAATEATGTWTEPAHARPCTATIHGRATPGGRPVTCTREAGHPENHVGPKQGSNGRVLWTDHQAGATRHGMAS